MAIPEMVREALKLRDTAQLESLLAQGSSIEDLVQHFKPGFGSRDVSTEAAGLLVAKGAKFSIHALSGFGLRADVTTMLAADPALVHAKGGDDCTPLHFSRNVDMARLFVERGANLDARDGDHNSTPAQWLIGDVPEVVGYLLSLGAKPDIFLATALGDETLVRRLIAEDPKCVSYRIGLAPEFPPLGFEKRGGTIYQWTLGFNSSVHQIALKKGNPEIFDILYEASPHETRFLVNCLLGRRAEAEALLKPGLIESLAPADLELMPRYCWETNLDYDAVKLMLDLGFPIHQTERTHGYTALHNAAFAGHAELVKLLLERGHRTDIRDPGFSATPFGYATWSATVGKRHPEGEFGKVVTMLIEAGSPWDPFMYPTSHRDLDEALLRFMPTVAAGAAILGDEKRVLELLTPEVLNDALSGAAKGGHLHLCRTLLDRGADANGIAPAYYGNPHLLHAAWGNNPDVVRLLLERGADVHKTNQNGSTPLHAAAGTGAKDEIIHILLGHGADPHRKNNEGQTPIDYANTHGFPQIAKMLQTP